MGSVDEETSTVAWFPLNTLSATDQSLGYLKTQIVIWTLEYVFKFDVAAGVVVAVVVVEVVVSPDPLSNTSEKGAA